MAKLIIDQKEYTLEDGAPIKTACLEAGVVFDCNTGVCGSCQIKVLEGSANLSGLTEEEIELGLDASNRLACQSRIRKDTVKITLS